MTESMLKIRRFISQSSTIAGNHSGISLTQSYLFGDGGYYNDGENQLYDNKVNLYLENQSGCYFGYNTGDPKHRVAGGMNCLSAPHALQIFASADSYGEAIQDGFDPNTDAVFSIPGYPNGTPNISIGLQIGCAPFAHRQGSILISKSNDSITENNSIVSELLSKNYSAALEAIKPRLGSEPGRMRVLPLLSLTATLDPGFSAKDLLDSLYICASSAEKAALQRARYPFLLHGRHWDAIRSLLAELQDEQYDKTFIRRARFLIDALDDATHRSFLADNFDEHGEVKAALSDHKADLELYRRITPSANVPYSMKNDNARQSIGIQMLDSYPNPSSAMRSPSS